MESVALKSGRGLRGLWESMGSERNGRSVKGRRGSKETGVIGEGSGGKG